jgi:XTP/dITP diphosphohydrolase
MPQLNRELVFATNNQHKLSEVQHLLGDHFILLTLRDMNIYNDIPEDYDTLEENALQKARYIYNISHRNCFADDTGLEVESLNGRPGVYSARYAGDSKDPKANIHKLLMELKGVENRKARFRTVVALIIDGKETLFEGVVNGKIIEGVQGVDGFGYDPIFLPDGYSQTFAEMNLDQKNRISHRSMAMGFVVDFLKNL